MAIAILSLANSILAIAAATIVRIKSNQMNQPGGVTAEMMEAQCQFAKVRRNKDQPPDLTTVRIPFFLHIYYETIDPGGLASITYLREAIAVAHMIGLHRESYYRNVQPEEQEIRRRTLWLLFVTERGVSIKHKLPVTIKTKIAFPSTIDTDEQEVLLAYQRLITMFWHFDQSGVFELLDSQDFDLSRRTSRQPEEAEALASVRKRLDDSLVDTHDINDVQALDIVVTRHWMRIILWRLAESHGFFSLASDDGISGFNDPISIARDLLATISRADKSAIEAHGAALDTKIFEIASTVADAYAFAASDSTQSSSFYLGQAKDVLDQLQQLLSRNAQLARMLQTKISQSRPHDFGLQQDFMSPLQGNAPFMDAEIERQLQAHGFHFTEPLGPEQSPGTDSMTGDMNQVSPQSYPGSSGVRDQQRLERHHSATAMGPQGSLANASPDWTSMQASNAGMGYSSLSPFSQMMPEMDFDFNALGVTQTQPFNKPQDR